MARLALGVLLSIAVVVLAGCNDIDSGKTQLVPTVQTAVPPSSVDVSKTGEADLVEQMVVSRQAYRHGLELLVQHYTKTGNNTKLAWAEKEMSGLNGISKYNYITEAGVAGPGLRANKPVPDADSLYADAVRLEEQAGQLLIIKDNNLLRAALEKYNQLISKYPSSDKIDDAAFRAAGIYEHFKEYTSAVLYYQRTYQWDPETTYPARFKAAFILDRQLHNRSEALQLYQMRCSV